jgi:hypothetical protein
MFRPECTFAHNGGGGVNRTFSPEVDTQYKEERLTTSKE